MGDVTTKTSDTVSYVYKWVIQGGKSDLYLNIEETLTWQLLWALNVGAGA